MSAVDGAIAAVLQAHAHHRAPTPWARARRLFALERSDVGVVVVYGAAIGVLSLATPVAVQALVNNVAFGSLLQPIFVLTLLLAVGLVAYGTVRLLQVWAVETILQRVFVRTFSAAGRRLAAVDLNVLDRIHAPDVLTRFFEVPPLQKALATLLVDGVGLLLQALVGFALLAAYHPLLLAFSGALAVGLVIVVFALGRGQVASALAESEAKYEAVSWLEHLARIPTAFRSSRGRTLAVVRTDEAALRWLSLRRTHFRGLVRQHVGGVAIAVVGSTALLGLGGVLVLREQLTLGQLIAAEIVIGSLSAAFVKLGKQLEAVYDVVTSATKLGLLDDLPLERGGGESLRSTGPMSVRFDDVTFAHAGRDPVLAHASFAVQAGAHVVIHGEGGSGKSTTLDLVMGLRAPQRGRILIDGLDAAALRLTDVRERVALVRDREVVEGTLLENLRLLAPDATFAEVTAVVELVGLDPVVRSLSAGYSTPLVPSGAPLSSSEIRRLTVARALLARPGLLLVDGALDALGLAPDAAAKLCAHIFASDAPWTAIVATSSRAVAQLAAQRVALRGRALVQEDA
jgi:ABC-type bacteriocin/lantibiotic exporter with double-glycine peptidase domain